MPARNRKSMGRESEPEPANLPALLRDAHREIKLLLMEMEDILDLPTAVFELYPRIRVALQAHDAGERYALYGPMHDMPELSDVMYAAESAHSKVDDLLGLLDRLPFRKEQIHSPQWKEAFLNLDRTVLDHFRMEEETIFPRMETLIAPARLDVLGDRYKRGLKGELGPLPDRNRGTSNVLST